MNITSIVTSFNVLPYSRLFSKQKVLQESKIKISKINISKIVFFEEIQVVVHIQIIKMSFEITFVVCGYHVYKDIWKVEIISKLSCLSETDYQKDYHAAAILQLFQRSWHRFINSLSSS